MGASSVGGCFWFAVDGVLMSADARPALDGLAASRLRFDVLALSGVSAVRRRPEMQDADLFMELAGIGGVFVGFGALIAVRGGGATDVFEVAWMRGVVSIGLVAVLAALAPVVISRYGLTEHEVWALSSILFFVAAAGTFLANNLSPEARAEAADPVRRSLKIVRLAVWLPAVAFLFLAPIAITAGLAPALEEALYFTLVAVALAGCAMSLLMLVFTGRPPASA